MIVSCKVSTVPLATYATSAEDVSIFLLFDTSSVNLNSLVPVANLSASFLGIKKEPFNTPFASDVNVVPEPSGCCTFPSKVSTLSWSENSNGFELLNVSFLVNAEISAPSKKG